MTETVTVIEDADGKTIARFRRLNETVPIAALADELERPKRRRRSNGGPGAARREKRDRTPMSARVLPLARPDWFDERIDRARLMAGR